MPRVHAFITFDEQNMTIYLVGLDIKGRYFQNQRGPLVEKHLGSTEMRDMISKEAEGEQMQMVSRGPAPPLDREL